MVPILVEAAEYVTVVGFAPAKIAVVVGTVCGDQFVFVFQSAPGPAQVDWARAAEWPRHAATRTPVATAAGRSRNRKVFRTLLGAPAPSPMSKVPRAAAA